MPITLSKMLITAPAKLNLFLDVTGKRDDGYHELYSLCVFLDLADEIELEEADNISCEMMPGYNIGEDNIALKAALELSKKLPEPFGCRIKIKKNIPVGGGLGGGSADAAATIAGLDRLWQLNLSHAELYRVAVGLGADVPVCLYSILNRENAAFFAGTGEIITPAINLPELYLVIVNPNRHQSTKEVFTKLNLQANASRYDFKWSSPEEFFNLLKKRHNRLENTAISLIPEIAHVISVIQAQENCIISRMSGSGASCFGLFTTEAAAKEAESVIAAEYAEWFVKSAKMF